MDIKSKTIKDYLRHKNKIQQLEFLSRSLLLEEVKPPFLVKNVTVLVMLILVVFIVWSSVYEVKELVKASGKVTPSGKVRAIQHLEGGIVKKIHVEEGSIVNKGTPLLSIENNQITAEYEKLTERKNLLKEQIDRLKNITASTPNEQDSTSELLKTMKNSFAQERSVLENQLVQKKNELNVLLDRKKNALRAYKNAKKSLTHSEKLYKQQLITRTQFLNTERESIELWSTYSQLKQSQKQLESAVLEFQKRLESLDASSKEKNLKELEELNLKFVENEKNIKKVLDQMTRLDLYSPVRGIVNNLNFHTIGGVITPGSQIMEIVPTSEELVVELEVAPEDIGHIELQQEVTVKVTSFDFSRFGAIKGRVINLSPTTHTNENKLPVYKIKVRLDKSYVGDNPSRFKLIPGMQVEGNIKAGSKTVMAYVLKPIHKSVSTALSEK